MTSLSPTLYFHHIHPKNLRSWDLIEGLVAVTRDGALHNRSLFQLHASSNGEVAHEVMECVCR